MSNKNLMSELAAFLRSNKQRLVQSRDLLVERWDPTYGAGDPAPETIECIDFDALCVAIDEFSTTFKE